MNLKFQISNLKSRGLMLIECLVYMGMWFTVLGCAMTMFYAAYVNTKQLSRNTDDIVRVLKAGERWRADVRATAPSTTSEASEFGEDEELTLRQASGWVKYRFEGGRALRRTQRDPDWREVLNGVKSSHMLREDRGGVSVWRWEIELLTHAKRPVTRPLFTFLATSRKASTP